MRISDWSSDVCSSDLLGLAALVGSLAPAAARRAGIAAALFLAGTLLFCGSLYLKALDLAALTDPLAPAGGFLLMAGWLALAWPGLGLIGRARCKPGAPKVGRTETRSKSEKPRVGIESVRTCRSGGFTSLYKKNITNAL